MGVLLVRIGTGWIHALPLVLFNNNHPNKARRDSLEASRGQRRPVITALALWVFLTPLAIATLTIPLTWLGLWAAPQLADRLPLLSFVLGLVILIQGAVAIVVGFIGVALLSLQTIRLFRRAGLDNDQATAAARRWSLPIGGNTIGLAAAVIIGLASFATYRSLTDMKVPDDAVIIAHRGDSGSAPENTMAAIIQAVEAGADWVEIDVQETADGEVVVFHDSDFKRVSGKNLAIWDATTEDLKDLDIGSWFDPKFADQRTPTLLEALEACRGRSKVLIELKYYGHDEKLEERVVHLIEEAGMTDEVALMSLKQAAVRKLRKLRPTWKVGLLSSVALGDIQQLDVHFLGLNASTASSSFINRAHRAGIQVHVWTVNDPVTMSSMLSRGVDGLITDEPGLAAKVIDQRAGLSPAERLLVEIPAMFGKPPKLPTQ